MAEHRDLQGNGKLQAELNGKGKLNKLLDA